MCLFKHGAEFVQHRFSNSFCNEQAFHGITGAVALGLGVVGNLHGLVQISLVINIDMTDTVQVFNDRHACLGTHTFDQIFTAAWNNNIDELGKK